MNTIVLTGGGTAGHVMPALALVPYLRPYFSNIHYAGRTDGVESKLAAASGLPFWGTDAVQFDRRRLFRNFSIPAVLRKASGEMQANLQRIGCDIVFSKGGYCALPTVLAARRLGIPIVCHESDRTIGLANRLTMRFTPHLLTSFDTTVGGTYMGNPIRDQIFEGVASRVPFRFSSGPVVLVMGGSMGAAVLNEAAVALAEANPQWNVVNLFGKSPVACARNNYYGIEFTASIADLYACCDVVVCRAGANTLFELAALGKKAICVPLPKGNSRGDQVQNAHYFAQKYGFDVLPQSQLSVDSLVHRIQNALAKEKIKAVYDNPNPRIARYVYDVYRQSVAHTQLTK